MTELRGFDAIATVGPDGIGPSEHWPEVVSAFREVSSAAAEHEGEGDRTTALGRLVGYTAALYTGGEHLHEVAAVFARAAVPPIEDEELELLRQGVEDAAWDTYELLGVVQAHFPRTSSGIGGVGEKV